MQVLEKQLTIKYDELTEKPRDYMSLTMVYDRKKRLIQLSQRLYVEKLPRMHNMTEMKGFPTPIIVEHNFALRLSQKKSIFKRETVFVRWLLH